MPDARRRPGAALGTKIVLIDLENVQPGSVTALVNSQCKVLVFVGANQTKLPTDLAVSMQRMGDRAEFIQISGSGPNALDFHIAFHIGHIAAKDPTASFEIISKDTGFDPLIRHLKSLKISAKRSEAISGDAGTKPAKKKTADAPAGADAKAAKKPAAVPGIVGASPAKQKPADVRAIQFADMLRLPKSGRPRTETSLSSSIRAFFGQKLTDQEVAAVVRAMKKFGFIKIEGTTVTYSFGVPPLAVVSTTLYASA